MDIYFMNSFMIIKDIKYISLHIMYKYTIADSIARCASEEYPLRLTVSIVDKPEIYIYIQSIIT